MTSAPSWMEWQFERTKTLRAEGGDPMQCFGPLLPPAAANPMRAIVYAQPAECARLDYAERGWAELDTPGLESARFEAQIVRLSPRALTGAVTPACQIELELRGASVRELPPTAALTARLAARPHSWLAALMDAAMGDGEIVEASSALRGRVVHYVQHTQLGRTLRAGLTDIIKGSDDEE